VVNNLFMPIYTVLQSTPSHPTGKGIVGFKRNGCVNKIPSRIINRLKRLSAIKKEAFQKSQ